MRVQAFPLRFSASASVLGSHRHPPPPNNSFKPTPCRGVSRVLCATLARVRHPAAGRLNSGVRRQKNICFQPRLACSVASLIFAPLPSLAAALIPSGAHAMLRIVRLARSNFQTFRSSASETVVGAVSVPRLTRSLRKHPAESSQVRVRAFPLRLSASAQWLQVCRHIPPA